MGIRYTAIWDPTLFAQLRNRQQKRCQFTLQRHVNTGFLQHSDITNTDPPLPSPPGALRHLSLGWRNRSLLMSHLGQRTTSTLLQQQSLFANAGPWSLASMAAEENQLHPGKTIPLNKQCSAPTSHNEVWLRCWHTHKILIKIMHMINNIGIQSTGLLQNRSC